MNPIKQTLLLIVATLCFSTVNSFSQEVQEKPMIEKETLENQFNFVYDKSYKFEDFKSIRISWFLALKSHVLDSLKNIKKELRKTQNLASAKDSQLDSLKTALEKSKQELTTVTDEKDSFRLLGILLSKIFYNSLVWFIILALTILLLAFVLLFKRSNSVTSQTKASLSELKDEFENFRKRALDREEKMARKHLDEMNKYRNS